MQRIGSVLKKFVSDYGLETGLTSTTIRNQWIRLVGQTIAEHTSPDVIKGKTIFIIVDTPQWLHHVSFYKQEILEKLKPYKITNVRFKLGRMPEITDVRQEIDNISLSEEDSRYIENTVKNIKDTELREKFRTLLANALKTRR